MTEKFNLERFLSAQKGLYETALDELASGYKRTHWMWFIFPQMEGLAMSETAHRYSIKSVEEAREYLEHPVLGSRLKNCAEALLGIKEKSATDIFSYPDDLKLRSCMTLFCTLADEGSVFHSVLEKYFAGQLDERTIEILNRSATRSVINTRPDISPSNTFKVFADRVTKVGKNKCGDSFAVEFLESEGILLLVVADGVSTCPCDWKASEVACEAVVRKFKDCQGSMDTRMVLAAGKANNAVRQIGGNCASSITSLTLATWNVNEDKIHFLNVGDSRLYLGPANDLEQITRDDVAPVLLKRNGEVVLNAGIPVFMRGVTRSLGQTDPLEFEVQTRPFRSHEVLLLVSDGISKNEAFTAQFDAIVGSSDLEEEFSQFIRDNSYDNRDDATLVAVWRTGTNDMVLGEIERCLQEGIDFRTSIIGVNQVLEFIKIELTAKMAAGFNSEVHTILDYAKEFGVKLDRDFLSSLLSAAISQGTDRLLVTRFRDLIRRT